MFETILSTIGTPRNYSDMLRKIFVFNFLGSLGISILVCLASPKVNALVAKPSVSIDALGVTLKIGYLIPPFLFALIARFVKLHDRISDLFGIRRKFDVHEILTPLAEGVSIEITPERQQTLFKERRHLMYRVFYEYASSTSPKIDEHLIQMALDRWTWWWVLVELLVATSIAFVVLLLSGELTSAEWALLALLIGVLASFNMRRTCSKPARWEVEAILADEKRKEKIRTELENALSD